MNPKHYVSLPLAKRMKELGFLRESDFEWIENGWGKSWLSMRFEVRDKLFDPRCFDGLVETADFKQHYAAYSVAELGEMMPDKSSTNRNIGKVWVAEMNGLEQYCAADTEADARAKLLIHLTENGLIEPRKV